MFHLKQGRDRLEEATKLRPGHENLSHIHSQNKDAVNEGHSSNVNLKMIFTF